MPTGRDPVRRRSDIMPIQAVDKVVYLSPPCPPIRPRLNVELCRCGPSCDVTCPYATFERAPLVSSPRSELPALQKALGRIDKDLTVPLSLLVRYTDLIERNRVRGQESALPYVRRATIFAAMGDYARSKQDAQAALPSPVAYYRLGVAEFELGNDQEATAAFLAGLKEAPCNPHLQRGAMLALRRLRKLPQC